MLMRDPRSSAALRPALCRLGQSGTTLLEVLVTILILSVGLLGLAGLQTQVLIAEAESYQRAQAILLMNDMVDRINTNRSAAASYVSANVLGVDDSNPPAACGTTPATQISRDLCDWGKELQGASETKGTGSALSKVGGLSSGRGCVQLVQAENAAAGVCTPGVYRVTVAWQGINTTSSPAVTCGKDLYGDDRYRRAISTQVSIGLPSCQ